MSGSMVEDGLASGPFPDMTAFDWAAAYRHPVSWDHEFPALSMPDIFFEQAKLHAASPLADFMGRKYSYAETASGVARVARGLQQRGIGRGDRVGLFLPNVPHYLAAYYGIMAAGAIAVNFSPLYTAQELAHQVADSGTRMLFTLSAAALFPKAYEVLQQSDLESLVVGSIAGVLPPTKSILYRIFRRGEESPRPADDRITAFSKLIDNDGQFAPPEIDPEQDVALLQYTGGTTGRPKGAMLTHQNLTANARQTLLTDPSRGEREDRMLGALPFFHVFANTVVLNRTILNGGEIVMLPRFDAAQVLSAIERTGATVMPGVPTMFQALLDHPKFATTDFSSLRFCISGGAPLPLELKRAFEEKCGARLAEGYGLTESSGVVSVNPFEAKDRPGTIGQPLPATRIRLLDKEDPTRLAPEGQPGELAFAGPQVMKGYWQRPDADEKVFVGEYLRTGDVAIIEADGYVSIVDRLKDMISVGGFKVFPSQVEEVLYRHPMVREALVIGVPDAYRGESPKAFVSLNEKDGIDGEALMAWLNPQLGKHERVIAVIVRADLPKTMIGKLDRKALRAEEGVA